VTGAQIDQRIKKLLDEYRIIGYHNPNSLLATVRGWPDWVFIGRRILYREVKGSNDTLLPEQRRMGHALSRAGGDFEVWESRHFYNGTIRRQLAAISPLAVLPTSA
jgi:hypothetical protein